MSQTNRRPQQHSRGSNTAGKRTGGASRFDGGQRYGTNTRGRAPSSAAHKGRGGVSSGTYIRDIVILAVGGIIVIVLAIMLQKMWPDGFPLAVNQKADGTVKEISEIYSSGPLRINEIMTADRYTVMTEKDEAVDWIEIMNVSNSTVNSEGYQLAKTANSVSVFTFPDMQLEAGDCVIVYADSKLANTAGAELHAPFRLSSGGDTLMLFNASGTAVDTVNIPALGKDISYARTSVSGWEVCEEPTPALANTRENYLSLKQPANDSPVILNEIVARNKTILTDENNQYNDYIELYNRSGSPVDLEGWYLSDNETNARRWRFPSVVIGPGEYLIVFASGLDKTEDVTHLHTNFGLSSEGEHVILSDRSGRRMDETVFDLMKQDEAYARDSSGNWSMAAPTPGSAN